MQRVGERMPVLSFGTVYRTLSILDKSDLISRVQAGGRREM